MNEIVKYHNHMNEISFRKFNSVELDLFFSICYQMKEKKSDIIQLSFSEIKQIAKLKMNYTIEDFSKILKSMYKKLIGLSFSLEDEKEYLEFVLFTKYQINKEHQFISIKINDEFSYILNDLTANFTRFELEEYTKLRSSYSKQMFKLLAQFKSTGVLIVLMNDFKQKLDIPNSYKMHHIDKFVLKPILTELPSYFKNLKLEKIKKGRNIDRLKFTFDKRKERTLGFQNGNPVTADERSFEEIREAGKNSLKEEFESLDRSEQARLVREQIKHKII